MQPTFFGMVLLPLCLAFVGHPVRLIQLVLVTAIFEGAAVLMVGGEAGGFGLQPSLVPGLLFLAHLALQYALGMRYPGEALVFRALLPLLAFAVWAIGATFVLTDVFAGMPVWPPRGEVAGAATPLRYGTGNVTQGLYLVLNVAVAVGAALFLTRGRIPFRSLVGAYLASGYLVVVLGVWQFAARLTGLWWPRDLLYSNAGWTIVEQDIGGIPRIQGPFSEPSSMGSYLTGIAFCCLWLCIRGHDVMRPRLLLILALFGIMLSTSASGIVALAVGLPLALAYVVSRGGGAGIRRVAATVCVVAAAGLIALGPVFILKPELMDAVSSVVQATVDKRESDSYDQRSGADLAAIEAVMDTYGLGVGWGSFRASSLVAGLLANSGVVGLLLILWLVIRLAHFKAGAVAVAPGGHPAVTAMDGFAAALSGVTIPALLAAPTITSMAFFIQIACLVGAAARVRVEAKPAGAPAANLRAATFWIVPAEPGGEGEGRTQTRCVRRSKSRPLERRRNVRAG